MRKESCIKNRLRIDRGAKTGLGLTEEQSKAAQVIEKERVGGCLFETVEQFQRQELAHTPQIVTASLPSPPAKAECLYPWRTEIILRVYLAVIPLCLSSIFRQAEFIGNFMSR